MDFVIEEIVLKSFGVFKKKLRSKTVFLGILLLVFGIVAMAVLPVGMPKAAAYFEDIEKRTLQKDEIGQLRRVQKTYDRMANTGDDFTGWNEEMQDFWKYAIAFSSYGLPSAMIIDSENEDEYRLLFDTMIWKMKSRRVWGDFTDRGFGSDPISSQNIMYKGHLNLMFGLYQLTTGDDRYAREYSWLSERIADELRLHHQGKYEGVTCEPNAWYPECNAIGMLSLHIYDKLYGTNYTENEVRWTLDFMNERMRHEGTGLYYRSYHPQQDAVYKNISGYANAWTLTFLNPFMSADMQRTYENGFKDNLITQLGPFYASVRGDARSDQNRNQVAHLFGLWAAKEFKDEALFGKLRNSIDKFGGLVPADGGGLRYETDDTVLMNGVVLSAKLHVGWKTVLDHDWGHDLPEKIPETSDMTWRDILPDNIYRMNNGESPLPVSDITQKACPNCYWGDYESVRMKVEKAKNMCLTNENLDENCGVQGLERHTFR